MIHSRILAVGMGVALLASSALAQSQPPVPSGGVYFSPDVKPAPNKTFALKLDSAGSLEVDCLIGCTGGGGGGAITGPLGTQTIGASVAVTDQSLNTGGAAYNALIAPIATQPSTVSIGGVGLLAGTANVGNLNPSTPCATTALAASLVCYSAPAVLHTFTVTADSTLDAAAWYLMVFNATSLPADGAVTPLKCYQIPAGTAQFGGTFDAGGATFSAGVTFGVSTTGCFTKTASTHALFIGGE